MARKTLFLMTLSFSLAIGGFWALGAQDPAQPAPKPAPQKTAATTTQLDLSGTYAGTFNCEPAGLTGDTTLTINGNDFTTSDGKTGRIVASKTKSYTAAALQVSGASSPVISLRARKSGNKLTLSPVAGSTQQCSFTTGKVAKGKATQSTPTATGTEVSNPKPTQTPSPTPEASPSPEASPTPSGSPRPAPSPSPTPGEPTPSPTPTPTPNPRPA